MKHSTLTTDGLLLIPKQLRAKYDFKKGGKIILEETDKGILIIPMNKQYFKSFMGILSSK